MTYCGQTMDNVVAMERIEAHKLADRRIKPYFTINELQDSDVALKEGIDNTPDKREIEALSALCRKLLIPIREHFDKPMTITSGFRCDILNRKVGGAERSYHRMGKAADFKIMGVDNLVVARWIQAHVCFDQLILEYYRPRILNGGWIHVSFDDECTNREEVWTKDTGQPYVSGLPLPA